MRLTCPACAAAYNVPDAMIGTGRQMRCARCGHQWFATPAQGIIEPSEPAIATPPEEPPPAPVTPPAAIPIVPAPAPAPENPQKGGARLVLAWLASILAVAGSGAAAWMYRAEIEALWPPFGRLVAWLGG